MSETALGTVVGNLARGAHGDLGDFSAVIRSSLPERPAAAP